MKLFRHFQLSRTPSALAPSVVEQGAAHSVVAGEACTEIGCEAARAAPAPWFSRWFGIGGKTNRPHERKVYGTRP